MDLHTSSPELSTAALSLLLSLPHMAEDKQIYDPPVCNPPQKHKPAIYYLLISLLILNKSQPHVNPPM